MSKFTRALNKIQNSRDTKPVKNEKVIPSYDLGEKIDLRDTAWEQGVRVVADTGMDPTIVNHHYPSSVISEQYRSLRTNLKARLAKDEARVFMISSSINSEGKTVTSLNLAYSFAEAKACKIVVVDADLRRGKIGSYLGLEKDAPGLTEYLSGNDLSFKDVVVRNSAENLFFIPRGKISNNPAGLVSSDRFSVLIEELRRNFDYVIVDVPPIMSVADAAILGKNTDGLVMVIQSGRTPKTVIAHAHELFRQAGIKLYGYVLTNVEFQSSDYRYYSYKYYGEQEQDESLKGKASLFLKRMGMNFQMREEKFSHWWKNKGEKRNGKSGKGSKNGKIQTI